MKFTFGSDPEFMLIYKGKYYSATGVVAGKKDCRITHGGNEYYYDNVMAECAIKPGRTKEEVIENFRDCFRHYAKIVHPYKLVPQASQTYTADQLKHEDARDVGCKLEYCAYALTEIEDKNAERIIKKTNFRSAGGHVHLGAPRGVLQDGFGQVFTIRMLDLFLGLPLIIVGQDETAQARRKLYGKAGRHRRPNHGLEYRTPDNYWLVSPTLVGLVYDLCQITLDFVDSGKHWKFWMVEDDVFEREDYWAAHKCHGYNVADLRLAIDYNDHLRCRKFLKLIEEYLPAETMGKLNQAATAHRMDFYKEWQL